MEPPSTSRSSPNPLSKRTDELRLSERSASVPPSLNPPQLFLATSTQEMPTVHEDLPSSPRRARADTLPSTFHLPNSLGVPVRTGNGNGPSPPPGTPGDASTTSLPPTTGSTPPPNFPFTAATSSPSLIPQLAARLRSGSLTLPSSSLSNPFGPPVWSGGWTAAATPQSAPGFRAARADVTSPDSSIYGDDSHVRTLDYLGLDGDLADDDVAGKRRSEGQSMMHSSSSFGNLRSIDLSQQVRMRSNTVATFPRSSPYAPSRVSEGDEETLACENSSTFSHRSSESLDSTRLLYSTATALEDDVLGQQPNFRGVLDSTHARARAATIGILDDSREVYLRRRAGTTTGMTPHALAMGQPISIIETTQEYSGPSEYPGGAASVMARGMRGLSLNQDENPAWSASRPITPVEVLGLGGSSASHQLPTRSLWIGNLDSKTTPAELQIIFAPYGAIESLRLIPEKECGFVNFVSVADAIHAKEDVLNRLGGQLSKQSGMVRIGFGKSDGAIGTPQQGLNQSRPLNGHFSGSPEAGLQNAPTRALWIGSIPASTTPNHLLDICAPFGPIESARVLPHKSCGFVNFEHTDDAVAARKALNGREILGAEAGTIRVGFAKVPIKVSPHSVDLDTFVLNPVVPGNGIASGPTTPNPSVPISALPYYPLLHVAGASTVAPRQQLADGGVQDYRSNLLVDLATNGQYASSHALQAGLSGSGKSVGELGDRSTVVGTVNEMQLLMRELGEGGPETEEHVKAVAQPRTPATYYTSIAASPAFSDPTRSRHYANADAPRLRDLRKKLESFMSPSEADSMALELVDECVPLSSDYIGNTIIQKIFERATIVGRKALLEKIAPHLAIIGTHKNGTWAVQKIIQTIQEPEEFALVTENLRPYCPPLLLNDFGNYVVQGALRFEAPLSDFIFDAMVDRCWEIGSGRFGARSTRQTLESPLASNFNIKRVAISIILNSIPLATNSNGALLITWLLDSSNLPGRYRVLSSRFAPHLLTLCTHKLASLAVYKIVNQRVDPAASRKILDGLFNEKDLKTLEEVLADQANGVTCISKILSSPALDQKERTSMIEKVRPILVQMAVQASPAYRRIIEETGLIWMGPPGASPSLPPTSLPQQSSQYPQQPPYNRHPSNHGPNSMPPQWAPPGTNHFTPYPADFQPMAHFPYGQPYPTPPQFAGGPYPYYVPYGSGYDAGSHYSQSQQPSPMMVPQSLPSPLPPAFNTLNGAAPFHGAPHTYQVPVSKGPNGKGPGF